MAQNNYDGLLQWFPLHHDEKQTKEQFGFAGGHGIATQTTWSKEMKSPPSGKCRQRPQRRRNQSNWASGGPGMQAIFLGSSPKSCGTGVFLPRTEGTNFRFSNKPALSPVLLPSRVVHALNLNVHEIGQQNKHQPGQRKYTAKRIDETKENKNKEDNVRLSPEIFLPKEWTY